MKKETVLLVDHAYAIVSNNKIILPYTIRYRKKDCISDYEKLLKTPFEELKKQGKRCLKVKISTNTTLTT